MFIERTQWLLNDKKVYQFGIGEFVGSPIIWLYDENEDIHYFFAEEGC